MMDAEWSAILIRYGQTVTLCEKGERTAVRAFLQPIEERGQEQNQPVAAGILERQRLLYLGPADRKLTADVTVVEWNGRRYDVRTAHPVGVGSTHHWWAVLCPGDKEVS